MRTSHFLGIALASLTALALTGCGDSPETTPDSPTTGAAETPDELTPLTVGIIPIATMAAVPYGVDEGIFEEHGLDVTIETGGGGAAMLPALQSGQMDVVIGNAANLLQAVDQGLDMRVIGGYSSSAAEGYDVNAVLVRTDSGIDSWADLEGKSVAVNAVRGQGDLTIMESVDADGGDPEAVNFMEVGFPEMQAQLELENVDAIWIPEPFLDQALENDDIKVLGHPNQIIPGLPTVVSFTTGDIVEQEPELVEKYQTAMDDVLTQFMSDEEGKLDAVMSFMNLPEDVAQLSIERDRLEAAIPEEPIRQLSELMVKYGFIESDPITDTFFVE